MRRVGMLVAAVGLVTLGTSSAWAQGRGRGPGFGGPGLLMAPAVQEELKLTDEQKEKIRPVVEKFRDQAREAWESLRDVPEEERFAKGREKLNESRHEAMTALREVLKPEQMRRFRQIDLQVSGAEGLLHPYVEDRLKLTDDQKERIEKIVRETRSKRREIFENAQGEREAVRDKMRRLREQAQEQVRAVLTDEQKDTYKELLGDRFEMRSERRPQEDD